MNFNNPGKLIGLAILAASIIVIAIFILTHNTLEQSNSNGRTMQDTVRARSPSSYGSAVLTQAQPSRTANITRL